MSQSSFLRSINNVFTHEKMGKDYISGNFTPNVFKPSKFKESSTQCGESSNSLPKHSKFRPNIMKIPTLRKSIAQSYVDFKENLRFNENIEKIKGSRNMVISNSNKKITSSLTPNSSNRQFKVKKVKPISLIKGQISSELNQMRSKAKEPEIDIEEIEIKGSIRNEIKQIYNQKESQKMKEDYRYEDAKTFAWLNRGVSDKKFFSSLYLSNYGMVDMVNNTGQVPVMLGDKKVLSVVYKNNIDRFRRFISSVQ